MSFHGLTVYGLIDPRDGQLRYVGLTTYTIKKRLQKHLDSRNTRDHRGAWIRQLHDAGLKPFVVELQSGYHDKLSLKRGEIEWITHYTLLGAKLVNGTPGGDGLLSEESIEKIRRFHTGKKRSAATCAKMSASHTGKTGRPVSDETRMRMSVSAKARNVINPMKGRKHSDETRAKMRIARANHDGGMLGLTHSEETKAKIRATLSFRESRPHSEETRQKMSASKRGTKWSAARRAAHDAKMHASDLHQPASITATPLIV